MLPPAVCCAAHDALDPEYSILKQRIARRLRHEGVTDESVQGLNLVDVTKVAERTISDDLEYLISKTVDTSKADYAGGWGQGRAGRGWGEGKRRLWLWQADFLPARRCQPPFCSCISSLLRCLARPVHFVTC